MSDVGRASKTMMVTFYLLEGIGAKGMDMFSTMVRKESLNKGLCHQFFMDIQIVIAAMD